MVERKPADFASNEKKEERITGKGEPCETTATPNGSKGRPSSVSTIRGCAQSRGTNGKGGRRNRLLKVCSKKEKEDHTKNVCLVSREGKRGSLPSQAQNWGARVYLNGKRHATAPAHLRHLPNQILAHKEKNRK